MNAATPQTISNINEASFPLALPEAHQKAALGEGSHGGRTPTPLRYLPLYARLAFECLDSERSKRNSDVLNEMLDAYAKTYGLTCDEETRSDTHSHCAARFGSGFEVVSVAAGVRELHVFVNPAEGVAARVVAFATGRFAGQFCVSLEDIDTARVLPWHRVYVFESAAIAYARLIAGLDAVASVGGEL